VPAGVTGDLYIGGASVARGYHRRPRLTAERFVPDPFSGRPGARLYRTGDLGRRRFDGALEYVGRVDAQVKIRGYRVELGEIEAALREHDRVQDAVATAHPDGQGTRLDAYVVARDGQSIAAADLRGYLQGRLPAPLVPSTFIPLDGLPPS